MFTALPGAEGAKTWQQLDLMEDCLAPMCADPKTPEHSTGGEAGSESSERTLHWRLYTVTLASALGSS